MNLPGGAYQWIKCNGVESLFLQNWDGCRSEGFEFSCNQIAPEFSGTMAVVVLLKEDHILVGNCCRGWTWWPWWWRVNAAVDEAKKVQLGQFLFEEDGIFAFSKILNFELRVLETSIWDIKSFESICNLGKFRGWRFVSKPWFLLGMAIWIRSVGTRPVFPGYSPPRS